MLESIFPEYVKTYECDPSTVSGVLYPVEEAYIHNALPKRRLEFTAGRLGAKKLLAQLNITDFPLLTGKNREPIWPSDICGSISHTKDFCGVVVAPKNKVKSLGLDVEQVGKLEQSAWSLICTPEELKWLKSFPAQQHDQLFALIFSSKECVYKCQYALTQQWVDFHDVTICINADDYTFQATFQRDVDKTILKEDTIAGKYLFHKNYVFSAITLESFKDL